MAGKSKVKDYATEYAKAVVAGKKEKACRAEIQACKRHLNDLKRSDLIWRPDVAAKHIQFAELLKVYDKNEKKYKPLKLRGFQKFILCNIFGWYTKTGVRRFSSCYIQEARKNGKSFLNAFLCIDFSSLSAIKDGQIYCAGTNYANASIVWQNVKQLIEGNPELNVYYQIKDYTDSRSRITNKLNKSIIKPLSGDTDKDGFLPYLACVDEYHLHNTDEMYNVLLDGSAGTNNTLIATITTAGKNLNAPCYSQYKYCKQVLSGTLSDDGLFAYIAEIDLPDPHKHEEEYVKTLWNKENWAMANPFLLYDDDFHVTKDANKWKDFEDIAIKAKTEEGSVLNNFIIKKLDVWTTIGSESYVSLDDWAKCGVDADTVSIHGKTCFVGLDLSSKNDLTSLSIVFPPQDELNVPYIYSHSFLPEDTLQKHIMRDKVPYDKFVKNGYLTLTDCDGQNGFIVDYKFVANFLKRFIKDNELRVRMICYDAMGIQGIMSDLDDIPTDKVEIVQTPKSMNETTRVFQGVVAARRLCYDKRNELLSWSIVNAVSVLNSKKELLIDKRSVKNRIDPIDAVLDAFKGYLLTYNVDDLTQAEKNEKKVDEWLSMMDEL